jgi:hypothetical protein
LPSDDASHASTTAGVVSRDSTVPREASAARWGDTSPPAADRILMDRSEAGALTSRPGAEPSSAVVDVSATFVSAEATGSAACTGSAGFGVSVTAAAGSGLSAATGLTVGCAGSAAAGACTAGGAGGATGATGTGGFATGWATTAGGGAADAGGGAAGRRGRRLSGST